jgi:CheY-like chemotaxis protein
MAIKPVVLVIEDNAELRHVLKEALSAEGYHVLTARDEADALEQLRANEVHLLISDLTNPPDATDETDVIQKEFPELPIVALQGATRAHPAFFFSAWGSSGRYRTIPKPFRLGELLAVSRDVLGAVSQA